MKGHGKGSKHCLSTAGCQVTTLHLMSSARWVMAAVLTNVPSGDVTASMIEALRLSLMAVL